VSDGVLSTSRYTKTTTLYFSGSHQQRSNSSNNFGSEESGAFHSGDDTGSVIKEVMDRSSTKEDGILNADELAKMANKSDDSSINKKIG
jgi:hypothetical protein